MSHQPPTDPPPEVVAAPDVNMDDALEPQTPLSTTDEDVTMGGAENIRTEPSVSRSSVPEHPTPLDMPEDSMVREQPRVRVQMGSGMTPSPLADLLHEIDSGYQHPQAPAVAPQGAPSASTSTRLDYETTLPNPNAARWEVQDLGRKGGNAEVRLNSIESVGNSLVVHMKRQDVWHNAETVERFLAQIENIIIAFRQLRAYPNAEFEIKAQDGANAREVAASMLSRILPLHPTMHPGVDVRLRDAYKHTMEKLIELSELSTKVECLADLQFKDADAVWDQFKPTIYSCEKFEGFANPLLWHSFEHGNTNPLIESCLAYLRERLVTHQQYDHSTETLKRCARRLRHLIEAAYIWMVRAGEKDQPDTMAALTAMLKPHIPDFFNGLLVIKEDGSLSEEDHMIVDIMRKRVDTLGAVFDAGATWMWLQPSAVTLPQDLWENVKRVISPVWSGTLMLPSPRATS